MHSGRKRIGLGTYPYINARVRAMKAGLIPKTEYMKLAKMALPDIARYLQEARYREEINEFAPSVQGADLIEHAICANLTRTFSKLAAISSGEVRSVLEAYLGRWDVWNVKALMRAKHSGIPREELMQSFLKCGKIRDAEIEEMLKKETVEDVLFFASKKGQVYGAGEALGVYRAEKNLGAAENVLDNAYYAALLKQAEAIAGQGTLFRAFLKTEIDVKNIKTILRLKREGFKKEDILKHLVYPGERLGRAEISRLAGAASMDELSSALMKTHYAGALGDSLKKLKETGSISHAETALDKYWLGKAGLMMHQHPLSINPIIGFMLSKEIEYKNLRLIARVKATGLPENVITENLVA